MSCIVLRRGSSNEVAACDAEPFLCACGGRNSAGRPSWPRAAAASELRRTGAGLAVAASAAAVAFIAAPLMRAPETVSLAKNSPPAMVDVAAQKSLPTIASARGLGPSFTPYLAAHRELIGNSVVPRATVYLRSAEDR